MVAFVNAHTHLDLSAIGLLADGKIDFTEWLFRLQAAKRALSAEQVSRAIHIAAERLAADGVEAVADFSRELASLDALSSCGIGGVVFIELFGRELKYGLAMFERARRLLSSSSARNGRLQIGLALHSPYTCHPDLIEAVARWCSDNRLPLSIHVAETWQEVEYLQTGAGRIRELNDRMLPGVSHFAPGVGPIKYLRDLGVLDARALLIHAVHVNDEDIEMIRRSHCSVVHCPRSNALLRCGRMPVEKFSAAGINISLGTDSTASVPNMSLESEIDEAMVLHGKRADRTFWRRAATIGGSLALSSWNSNSIASKTEFSHALLG